MKGNEFKLVDMMTSLESIFINISFSFPLEMFLKKCFKQKILIDRMCMCSIVVFHLCMQQTHMLQKILLLYFTYTSKRSFNIANFVYIHKTLMLIFTAGRRIFLFIKFTLLFNGYSGVSEVYLLCIFLVCKYLFDYVWAIHTFHRLVTLHYVCRENNEQHIASD